MKIKIHHFNHLESKISSLIRKVGEDLIVRRYEKGCFPNSVGVQNLQKRLCFDLLYAAKIEEDIIDAIYEYADDRHIFTALKRICPKVSQKY